MTRGVRVREKAQRSKANISRYKPSTYILHTLGRKPVMIRVITKENQGHQTRQPGPLDHLDMLQRLGSTGRWRYRPSLGMEVGDVVRLSQLGGESGQEYERIQNNKDRLEEVLILYKHIIKLALIKHIMSSTVLTTFYVFSYLIIIAILYRIKYFHLTKEMLRH